MRLVFRAQTLPTLSSSDIAATRLKGTPKAGEVTLSKPSHPDKPLVSMRHSTKWNSHLVGVTRPERKTLTAGSVEAEEYRGTVLWCQQ